MKKERRDERKKVSGFTFPFGGDSMLFSLLHRTFVKANENSLYVRQFLIVRRGIRKEEAHA